MELAIQNTKDLKNPRLSAFFYGDMGSGKTSQASTWPKPLYLAPPGEGSELTLKGLDFDYLKLGVDAKGVRVPFRPNLVALLNELERRHNLMLGYIEKGDHAKASEVFPWMTIVCESLTHWCEAVVEDIMASPDPKGNKRAQMDQQAWGLVRDHFRWLHDRLCRWDVNVVYLSLSELKENDNKIAKGQAAISGRSAIALPASCDITGYCEAIPPRKDGEATVYRTHFRKKGLFDARTRFREIPAYVDDCTYQKIAKLIGYDVDDQEK
jgi:hypothetical protein